MTSRNQPHKYRCETCKKTIHECPICVTGAYEIAQLHDITSHIGCASHSNATKAEQRIADVIAELEKRESEAECGLTLTDYHKIVSMLHELALLREKGE